MALMDTFKGNSRGTAGAGNGSSVQEMYGKRIAEISDKDLYYVMTESDKA